MPAKILRMDSRSVFFELVAHSFNSPGRPMSGDVAAIIESEPMQSVYVLNLASSVVRSFDQQRLCDCEIDYGALQTLGAHRVVLAASCPYFDSIFSSHFKESAENSITIQLSSEEQRDCFPAFIRFLYTGNCPAGFLNLERLPAMMQLADRFMIDRLCAECCGFALQCLQHSGAASIILDTSLTLPTFAELSKRALQQAATQIQTFNDDSWESLSSSTAIALLRQRKLALRDEYHVFTMVLKWIEQNCCRDGQLVDEHVPNAVDMLQTVEFRQLAFRHAAVFSLTERMSEPLFSLFSTCFALQSPAHSLDMLSVIIDLWSDLLKQGIHSLSAAAQTFIRLPTPDSYLALTHSTNSARSVYTAIQSPRSYCSFDAESCHITNNTKVHAAACFVVMPFEHSASGQLLICTASSDLTVRVWRETAEGVAWECVGCLEGHAGWVTSLSVVGDYIISGSHDASICVWRCVDNPFSATSEDDSSFDTDSEPESDTGPWPVARGWSWKYEYSFTESHSDTVRAFALFYSTTRRSATLFPFASEASTETDTVGRFLISCSYDGTICLLDCSAVSPVDSAGEPAWFTVLVLRGHQAAVMSLAIRYGGSQSALAAEHHAQHDNAWSISSSDTDPDVLVSAGFDRSVRVWSLSGCSAGTCLHALNIAGRLTSIASHFEYFVAGGENGTIFVLQLDLSGCSLVATLDASATSKVQSVLSVGPYVLCATTKSGVLIYQQHDFGDCKSLRLVRAMSAEDKVHHLAWLSGRLFVATSERVEVFSN